MRAVLPLAPVPNTVYLLVQAHSAGFRDVHVARVPDAVAQHAHAVTAVVFDGAFVECFERELMLQGAIFNERFLGDGFVVAHEAEVEAEVLLGVGVQLRCAELDDVSHAFAWAVHAFDAVVVGWSAAWFR